MTNNVTDTNVGKMTEEEAIKKLREDVKMGNMFGNVDVTEYKMAIEALQFQQSVVRCKDCHFGTQTSPKYVSCDWWDAVSNADGFCCMGRERDEE